MMRDDSSRFSPSDSESPTRHPSGSRRDPTQTRSSTSPSPPRELTPARVQPTKSELSSYVSFLRDLDRSSASRPLSARLLAKWAPQPPDSTPSSPRPALGPSAGPSGSTIDIPLSPLNGDITPNADHTTVDPATADDRLDTRWPLEPDALKSTRVDLAEMIRTIAARQIRTKKLSLPLDVTKGKREATRREHRQVEAGASGQDELDELDELEGEDGFALPEDIVESTTALVDQILVGLAVMRPRETRSKRKIMEPIGWEGVVQAAGLIQGNEG